jgi:hypothetical protein
MLLRTASAAPWMAWGMGAMAQQVCVVLSAAEREQLAAIADRPQPAAQAGRAGRTVLASAYRGSAQQVMHSIGVGRPTVWLWQQRFAESGVEGLLRDKARKPGKADRGGNHGAGGGIDPCLRGGRLCTAPPHQATHWTGRAMAKRSASRWLRSSASGERTNCSRTGSAPLSARAIPALPPSSPTLSGRISIRRPRHCVVDRRKEPDPSARPHPPGLPIKPGRCPTMTHDYKRHSLPSRKRGAPPLCSPRSACSTAP